MRKRNRPETQLIQPMNPPQMLTIPEVAAVLKISRTKVYDLIKNEGLPVAQFGDLKRVPIAKLEKWLADREQQDIA
jgi:excisionase family DNA binding protein